MLLETAQKSCDSNVYQYIHLLLTIASTPLLRSRLELSIPTCGNSKKGSKIVTSTPVLFSKLQLNQLVAAQLAVYLQQKQMLQAGVA